MCHARHTQKREGSRLLFPVLHLNNYDIPEAPAFCMFFQIQHILLCRFLKILILPAHTEVTVFDQLAADILLFEIGS